MGHILAHHSQLGIQTRTAALVPVARVDFCCHPVANAVVNMVRNVSE